VEGGDNHADSPGSCGWASEAKGSKQLCQDRPVSSGAIASGLENILSGLHSILNNTLTDPEMRSIFDGVFTTAIAALNLV
jgi:hypothetical protein